MDGFAVQLTRSAIEDLDRIPEKLRKRVGDGIKSLSDNPLPPGSGIKKLKSIKPAVYRLRSGDYRILFRIESTTVIILRVIDRRELDKTIRRWKL